MTDTSHKQSPTAAEAQKALTLEAISMLTNQDMSHWSAAHDRVAIDAMREALADEATSGGTR